MSGTEAEHSAKRVAKQDEKSALALKRKDYEDRLRKLHVKLVELGMRVNVRVRRSVSSPKGGGAGKGGTINAITARVNPRIFRVVALPAPTEREKSQMYVQRYLPHLPSGGEVVIFDLSWYNRAGVERVMGFCTEEDAKRFPSVAPQVEKAMVDSGTIPLKYWLEVSPEGKKSGSGHESTTDARSGSSLRWICCRLCIGTTTRGRGTKCSRRRIPRGRLGSFAQSDNKRRARLNIVEHVLANIPYEGVPRAKVRLPRRHAAAANPTLRLPQ